MSAGVSGNHRSKLDVYGVVGGDLLLQVLELLHVLAAAGLHHVLKAQHSWLSAIQKDHATEVWESESKQRNVGVMLL